MINANSVIRVGATHSVILDQPIGKPACLLKAMKSMMAMEMEHARQIYRQSRKGFLTFIVHLLLKKESVMCALDIFFDLALFAVIVQPTQSE
jgi:hypothetical protein